MSLERVKRPTYDIDKVEELAEEELVHVEVVAPQGAQDVVADQCPSTLSL
jgi:hypothetical protein